MKILLRVNHSLPMDQDFTLGVLLLTIFGAAIVLMVVKILTASREVKDFQKETDD